MSPFDSPNLSFTNRPYVAQLKLLPRSNATIPICSTGFTRVVKWHYMLHSGLACNTNLYTMWCKLTKFSDVTWPQTVCLWATLNSDDFTYICTYLHQWDGILPTEGLDECKVHAEHVVGHAVIRVQTEENGLWVPRREEWLAIYQIEERLLNTRRRSVRISHLRHSDIEPPYHLSLNN